MSAKEKAAWQCLPQYVTATDFAAAILNMQTASHSKAPVTTKIGMQLILGKDACERTGQVQ